MTPVRNVLSLERNDNLHGAPIKGPNATTELTVHETGILLKHANSGAISWYQYTLGKGL